MGEFFIFSFFAGMLSFLFPVFVYLDGYADVKENKFCFSLSLYKYLKVFGGYGQIKTDGIAVHISEKKAIFVPYESMTDTRKKFEITKGFQLYRYHQIIETGNPFSPYGVLLAGAIQAVSGGIFSVMQTRHPFLSLKNSTVLSEENNLKVSVQAVTVFNGLVVSIALGKKILEAFINWIRKKRSIALWKKRQNS